MKEIITSPNQLGSGSLPSGYEKVTFNLSNGDWIPEIKLPTNANEGAFVIVRSQAMYSSKVMSDKMLYESTTIINTNDEYVFKFLSGFNGWVVYSAPERKLNARDINFQIPYPTSQKTIISFGDQNWIEKIKLPQTAGDRDKITLTSTATFNVTIDPSNVNNSAIMILHSGEQYDFFYIAENKKWQLMKHPDTIYQAKDIPNGSVPNLERPRTIINVANSNWHSVLKLPSRQQEGSRVIVQSSADYSFTVQTDNNNHSISNGEIVVFKFTRNLWIKETVTIDLLMLYSNKAVTRLGENVMRNRLIEGLKLTNDALENSGANFRFRMCGLKQITAKQNWKTLGEPLNELRTDPTVQEWRNSLKADGIYYEGTEEGCGLAWINDHNYDSSFNMLASGSINCGTNVMRHELGHSMGIPDYNESHNMLATIMSGNTLPYYSTPYRYTLDYGIPMLSPDKINAVEIMNKFSSKVASYRN